MIDESSFLSHSDISYDRTDDDVVRTLIIAVICDRYRAPLWAQGKKSHWISKSWGLIAICFHGITGFGHNFDQTTEISSQREEGKSVTHSFMFLQHWSPFASRVLHMNLSVLKSSWGGYKSRSSNFPQRSSMGLPVGAPAKKRSRGGNMSSELLERKTIEKVKKREKKKKQLSS